ncbi:MAG: exodeoxyribonuclease VII small subunit [Eggerthellaceae bacterium]|nr:exodeoxyribonuclease VII small subunit [Eggerthellaceae bacterium]
MSEIDMDACSDDEFILGQIENGENITTPTDCELKESEEIQEDIQPEEDDPEARKTQYDAIIKRLDELADNVKNEELSLDEALAIYEEAVNLSLSAVELSEEDVDGVIDDSDYSLN